MKHWKELAINFNLKNMQINFVMKSTITMTKTKSKRIHIISFPIIIILKKKEQKKLYENIIKDVENCLIEKIDA